jgi:hypothetical protein
MVCILITWKVKSKSAGTGLLDFQVPAAFKPSSFALGVSPDDIATLIGLEIPWGDENNIAFANPDTFLQGPTDAAESSFAVSAFDTDPVITE